MKFVCLSKMCSPRGAAKSASQNVENPKMFGSHRLYNGFTHIQMQIRCKTKFGCISTCPRLVLKGPGPENRVQGPGPENVGLSFLFVFSVPEPLREVGCVFKCIGDVFLHRICIWKWVKSWESNKIWTFWDFTTLGVPLPALRWKFIFKNESKKKI